VSSSEAVATSVSVAPRPARWPWLILAGFVAMATVGITTVVANRESVALQVPYVIAFAMFGAVGALIASRDRGNRIGFLFLFSSGVTAASFVSGELVTYGVAHHQHGWWLVVSALLNSFGWLFGILPTVFLLPLLFPDGHLPSPRWRPLVWFIAVVLAIITASLTLGQRTLTGSSTFGVSNPLYIAAVGRWPTLDPAIAILLPGIFATSIVSLIQRFRRSSGVERQQIKWVVFAFGLALVGLASTTFSANDSVVTSVIGGLTFLLLPVSIGIAVLRFHLYDLDVVVRKTVVYGAFAVFATLVYLAVVVGLGATLGKGNSFLTMVAAVVVAVTFQPVRARLTHGANRLVYGKRATPYEVLSEFSERVGGAYADEDVLPRMARVVAEGTGAERADVWLKVGDELRVSATWPADAMDVRAVHLANGSLPVLPGADATYPVEHQGELLGALAVKKPPAEPMTPAETKLVADLASQTGLVLRNVRLTAELEARIAELRALHKRLVTAQDEERRRLERNIHDGAQQQLVALAVKARLARGFMKENPAKADELLEGLESETQGALENLRDLARGIYPPLLADKGLAAALDSQIRKSATLIELDAKDVGRYPQDVEAAAYFCCLEAVQNVAKYANALRATITLREISGDLLFEVADDGEGFDPSATGYGTGLQGMADRLSALDGTLEVRSAPGSGTVLAGRIPLGDKLDA
jgi:signal transduction histidine kinase